MSSESAVDEQDAMIAIHKAEASVAQKQRHIIG